MLLRRITQHVKDQNWFVNSTLHLPRASPRRRGSKYEFGREKVSELNVTGRTFSMCLDSRLRENERMGQE